MKNYAFSLFTACLALFATSAPATTFFVNANNAAPVAPYTNWLTAATHIQDAIDATTNGDTVLVTNGVYAFGGRIMAGDLVNRVALSNAITVQSVNGPWVTTILGGGATNGVAAVRCAWLTNGASLFGFTLMWGATRNSGDLNNLESGGGVWCAATNCYVGNCVIVSNTAFQYGGGVYQGTVRGSLISSNGGLFSSGGASYKSVLNNCTIVSNANYGVASPVAMTNCIIYFNGAGGSQNYSVSGNAFSHCCTTPALSGTGNFTSAPQLFADGAHLAAGSPCIGAGVNLATGTDIFGNAWSNPPAVGCAEWTPLPLVSTPQIKLTGDPVGFTIGNFAVGSSTACNFSWLKDGALLSDNGHFSGTLNTNLVVTGVTFADAGNYQVIVSNAFGVVTSSVATLVFHCVDVACVNPVAPYLAWSTAATNIQDAITAAAAGDVVLVTNGLYATGGKSTDGAITNRVSIDKAIMVQSVNGANATVIQGAWDPTGTNGPAAIRCVWIATNAILGGFTITGGATRANTSGNASGGGGIFALASNTIANCTISNNTAALGGGGAISSGGVLASVFVKCLIKNNAVLGVPGYGLTVYGGGADNCTLKNCIVSSNYAVTGGGGTYYGFARNCLILGNSANVQGGGAYYGTLTNCTLTKNFTTSSYDYGGGASFATLANCIVYANSEPFASAGSSNYYQCTFSYSCAYPLASSGTGNISANPQLLPDGVHLAATSPCIGTGSASAASGTDIDGQPWNNPPSMGCDEWNPAPLVGLQPSFLIGAPAHGLTCTVSIAGQTPLAYFWSKDGTAIQDDGHHSNSGTANMVVNNLSPDDAGAYQVIATNAFGAVTSAVVQLVIHAVNAAGTSPTVPFSSWATAATTIQDAINISAPGDVVLVTNGIYASGGMAMASGLTNRVALNKAITVMSANGYATTVIQGAWDPSTTNGPGAIRCVWMTNGAVLNGFTLQNGATLASGDAIGGGAWCSSSNAMISDCVFTNNSAFSGGGIAYGTLNNSLVVGNSAHFGGGTFSANLNNCTVENNTALSSGGGAGTYSGILKNCIVVGNYDLSNYSTDNYNQGGSASKFSYSCSSPTPSGTGNINVNPAFLDWFHISTISLCRAAGNSGSAGGYDLDGEPWSSPPSMGCDEVIPANLVGPLFVTVGASQTNLLVNRTDLLSGFITGRAASTQWSFDDGTVVTNLGAAVGHQWTNGGDYNVTLTVFNNDNPAGVSGNLLVHVQALAAPQLQIPTLLTNGFQFQFAGQNPANYTIQYATNLIPPITWQTLQTIYFNSQSNIQILDPAWTNAARFYRVLAQ